MLLFEYFFLHSLFGLSVDLFQPSKKDCYRLLKMLNQEDHKAIWTICRHHKIEVFFVFHSLEQCYFFHDSDLFISNNLTLYFYNNFREF